MASQIQPLPAEVVHLIAAGEVIDSLAAVVRELVENALDAGATRLIISIWPDQWRVQVVDNGIGMDLDNLKQAATAHSTSKIKNAQDLWQITTLGFRGEALHSLAQLASLEILSRPNKLHQRVNPAQQECEEEATVTGNSGWRVVYDRLGEPMQVETVAIAPGTVVTVSDLFENWPVRRGMTPPVQQLRLVQLTLHQIALCYPRVTWQVRQGDTPWFSICPGLTARQIFPQILRGVQVSDLQYLTWEFSATTEVSEDANAESALQSQFLELVLGLPDRCHRRRPDWVKVAVNGRMVRSSELEQTILTTLSRTCPRDRYPLCFVHLRTSPEQIDWNRHPAKAEIYLHNLTDWQAQAKLAIERVLHLNSEVALDALLPKKVEELLRVSEQPGGYLANRAIAPMTNPDDEGGDRNSEGGFLELRAIAQVHNTYILAEHPSGMWLIEQHIAHERVLYEQLSANWQLVPLETPIVLNQLSPTQIENLQRIGLDIETFGEQLWAVRTIPALLAKRDDCQEALFELSKVGDLQAAQVATACRSAIRNGIPLELLEMQTLLDQWKRTRYPRTCPHGRPIFLRFEESSLARFFRRHWVIGKSHGI